MAAGEVRTELETEVNKNTLCTHRALARLLRSTFLGGSFPGRICWKGKSRRKNITLSPERHSAVQVLDSCCTAKQRYKHRTSVGLVWF